MGNEKEEFSNDGTDQHGQPAPSQGTGSNETITTKKTVVRQRLAIALMAVGGVLVAAILWLTFFHKGGAQ